jgi:hypothetical protein
MDTTVQSATGAALILNVDDGLKDAGHRPLRLNGAWDVGYLDKSRFERLSRQAEEVNRIVAGPKQSLARQRARAK